MQNTTYAPPAPSRAQEPQNGHSHNGRTDTGAYEPSVTEESTNYVDLAAPRSAMANEIHVPGVKDKLFGHLGKLQKFQDMTIGDAQKRASSTAQRVSAEVAATTRGIVAGGVGYALGILEGIPSGAGAALLGPDRLFLLRLKTQETSPDLIGLVEQTTKRDGVGFISFRLMKNLDGSPVPQNTVSKPMPTTSAFRSQVNLNGDVFEAVLMPIEAKVDGRAKIVGFIAIDDRDMSHRPVYRVMKPAR